MKVHHRRRLQLTIHFSFFAVLLLLTQLTRSDWGLWCVGACLLHEAGHILAYSAFGAFPKAIHLEAGGIRIVPPDRPLPPKAEELVLLAGPLFNLLCGGALLAIRCPYAAGFHLLVGAFNLLPLPALDGGQLLELLAEHRLSLRAADRLCFWVGLLTLMSLLSGGWLLFRRTGNFTLLLTLFTLLTAAFPGKN